jgi:hypothetical protein
MKCEKCGKEYPSKYWFHGERETRPLICIQCEIPESPERAESKADFQPEPGSGRPESGYSIHLVRRAVAYLRERDLVGFLIALAVILVIVALLLLPLILFGLHRGPI